MLKTILKVIGIVVGVIVVLFIALFIWAGVRVANSDKYKKQVDLIKKFKEVGQELEDEHAQHVKIIEKHLEEENYVGALRQIREGDLPLRIMTMGWMRKNTEKLPPPILFELSAMEMAFDTEQSKKDALKWFYAARLRASYDAWRCEDATCRQGLFALNEMVPDVIKYVLEHPDEAYQAGIEALQWDKEHPSTTSPMWICIHGIKSFTEGEQKVLPEDQWPRIYEEMRQGLTEHLDTVRQEGKEAYDH